MVYVYILLTVTGKYYCGITSDLDRRFSEHQTSKRGWTSRNRPDKYVFTQAFHTRKEARKKEVYIKNLGPGKFVKRWLYSGYR